MKTKKAILLFSNNRISQFMQNADVFEGFKVYVQNPIEVTVVHDFGQKHVDAMIKQSQDSNYNLVAVVTEGFRWFNPKVKVVSNGKKWCTLEQYFGETK